MIKKFFPIIFIFFAFYNFSLAEFGIWGLDDINIISRKEWGADETFRYETQKVYQDQITKEQNYEKYLLSLRQSDISKYAQEMQKKLEKEKKENTKNTYLSGNFQYQWKLSSTLKVENGNTLRRPIQVKNDKTTIIIHHTVDDYTQLADVSAVKEKIRNIYKYHALNKLRGDIGYNFLIDHLGNIYEGKAGGPGVTGAHSSRNNRPSIGISLIGNFEIQKPTIAQLKSLVVLSAALSKKYNINPFGNSIYHKDKDSYPYLADISGYNIVGHRDTGTTACPGKFMYEKLPYIRQMVNNYLESKYTSVQIYNDYQFESKMGSALVSPVQKPTSLPDNLYQEEEKIKYKNITYKTPISISGKTKIVTIPLAIEGDIRKCSSLNLNFKVSNCVYSNGNLSIQFDYESFKASGTSYIRIDTSKYFYKLKTKISWDYDLQGYIEKKKSDYKSKSGFVDSTQSIEKISYKNTLIDVRKSLRNKVKVLLYQLSTEFDNWQISCSQDCVLDIDNVKYSGIKSISVKKNTDNLDILVNGNNILGKVLQIETNGEISFDNYDRKSYAGTAWNVFKGKIIIQNDLIKPLGKDLTDAFVVVNELPLDDYMQGVAEANDQVHYEKIKVMSLISKSYILFYMNKKNSHPSIPKQAYYNSVDDARIFQKYVGNGYSRTVELWGKALQETKNQVITYNGYVPILPYFNCSQGFTLSGKEKYGWTDTPYLKSQIDFSSCEQFNGHGVGLSGNGAELLAQKGIKYSTIIKYYYPGVKVSKIY